MTAEPDTTAEGGTGIGAPAAGETEGGIPAGARAQPGSTDAGAATVADRLVQLLFRHAQVKATFERLDTWIRRRFRCVQFGGSGKKPRTREAKLLGAGLSPERAWTSAYNGRGPWWNAGASHMNAALPTRYFETHGLVSLLSRHRRWQVAS